VTASVSPPSFASPMGLPLASFLAAAAKLKVGLTVALVNRGEDADGGPDDVAGEMAPADVGGSAGGPMLRDCGGLSVPVREVFRLIECVKRSLSFSSRSATAASFAATSTGLAAPKGLERDGPVEGLGEDSGDVTVEFPDDFGRSSSFRRMGVGGADSPWLPRDIGRADPLLQSESSVLYWCFSALESSSEFAARSLLCGCTRFELGSFGPGLFCICGTWGHI